MNQSELSKATSAKHGNTSNWCKNKQPVATARKHATDAKHKETCNQCQARGNEFREMHSGKELMVVFFFLVPDWLRKQLVSSEWLITLHVITLLEAFSEPWSQ